jgi:hypothetical protein
VYLFIYLFVYLLINSFIYLITGLYGINEPITMAAWPVLTPTAEHSTHIGVSAVLCVFLFSPAGTGIARSGTKFQKEIQKCQKHQPLSYIDLSCHKDRL